MTLLKMHQNRTHEYIFKFIYGIGYLYTPDPFIMESSNNNLIDYTKVPKGYKHETIKNI